jgi:hypothetical protein
VGIDNDIRSPDSTLSIKTSGFNMQNIKHGTITTAT